MLPASPVVSIALAEHISMGSTRHIGRALGRQTEHGNPSPWGVQAAPLPRDGESPSLGEAPCQRASKGAPEAHGSTGGAIPETKSSVISSPGKWPESRSVQGAIRG